MSGCCCATGLAAADSGGGIPADGLVVAEVDFAAWPETDFAAGGDGVYVLDGLPWTVVSSAAAAVMRRNNADVGDDGDFGFRIQHALTTNTSFTSSTQTAPRFQIPLETLVPSWSPTSAYLVEVLLTRAVASGTIGGALNTSFAAQTWKPSGTPPSWASFTYGTVLRWFSGGGGQTWRSAAVGNNNQNANRTDLDYDPNDGGKIIAWPVNPQQTGLAYTSQGTAWPTPQQRLPAGNIPPQLTGNANVTVANTRDSLLVLALMSGGSYAGQLDVMAHRLRVLQVAA